MSEENRDIQEADEVVKAVEELLAQYIVNPIQPDEDGIPVIMVAVRSEGQLYIGGTSSLPDSDDLVFTLSFPIRVMEGLSQASTGELVPQVSLHPVSYALDMMDYFTIKASSYYLLRKGSGRDQAMVTNYGSFYNEMNAARHGLVAPTPADIGNLKQGHFGNGPRQ